METVELKTYTIGELMDRPETRKVQLLTNRMPPFATCECARSKWRLNAKDLTLVYGTRRGWTYEVDLERCTNSAAVLDWIMQVAGKPFNNRAKMLCGLLDAIQDILNPQALLCSFAIGGNAGETLTEDEIKDIVTDYAKRPYKKDD